MSCGDFSTVWGLPQANLQIVAPDGLTPFDINDDNMVGWSGEISLDVQWAHAIAPKAKIVLVLAKSNEDADILSALTYAVNHNLGDVISMSFGEAEQCFDPKLDAQEHKLFAAGPGQGHHADRFVGRRRRGPAGLQGRRPGPSWPPPRRPPTRACSASAARTSRPISRRVSTSPSGPGTTATASRAAATASATPSRATRASFVSGKARGVPDVAYNGGVYGGVIVAWYVPFDPGNSGPGSFWIFGGTSAGAPQWAGITALDRPGLRASRRAAERRPVLQGCVLVVLPRHHPGEQHRSGHRWLHDDARGGTP